MEALSRARLATISSTCQKPRRRPWCCTVHIAPTLSSPSRHKSPCTIRCVPLAVERSDHHPGGSTTASSANRPRALKRVSLVPASHCLELLSVFGIGESIQFQAVAHRRWRAAVPPIREAVLVLNRTRIEFQELFAGLRTGNRGRRDGRTEALFLILAAVIAASISRPLCAADVADAARVKAVEHCCQLIRPCQLPDGMIRMRADSDRVRGVPYFANMAAIALLASQSAEHGRSDVDRVARWLAPIRSP